MKNLLKKSRQLVVIGAGGHASNIVNVAASLNYSIFGFIDSDKASQTLFGRPILSDLKEIVALENYDFCLALGDNYQREKYFLKILKMYPNIMFPTLIHSTASIGPYTKIGAGTVIMPNTTISTNVSIGSFCLLNNQSCVGHNSILYDFSSLGPAATLSGNVSVGLRSAIALGAKVREKVRVGNDVVLGPNSFLNHNLPNNVLAFGSPAVIKKARKSNDCYLR
jgi:sugar O-acyltransferase (sialic acid O-acetyltransferase NeuD family)